MSGSPQRDAVDIGQRLVSWLYARLPDAQEITLPHPRRPEAGGSSDTLFLEPTIRERDRVRREEWVLRIEAVNRIYQAPSIERQYGVMRALAHSSAVPVPKVLWYEADASVIGAPFFLMERVAGCIPDALHNSGGYLRDLSAAERESVWLSAIEVMAKIHTVEVEPFHFLGRPALGETGLDQEIAFWSRYLHWSGAPPRPVQERALEWLQSHLPSNRPTGLAWGDARPGNMIFRNNRCAAVIDWETVSLGGAETDLGWWLFYDWLVSDGFGVTRLPGLGRREDTIEVWESFAGRKAQDMEWHEVFATWRFSMISDRARHLVRRNVSPNDGNAAARSPHAERLAMLLGT